ncbi:MAG: OmpA family protein [Polyangiaceae bacterium]|nr:OmpA family protein [Polyangiaceae bacterium]
MRQLAKSTLAALALFACGGGQATPPPESPAAIADPASAAQEPAEPAPAAESESDSASPGSAGSEGSGAPSGSEFKLAKSDSAKSAGGVNASKIKPSKTEAAMKFVVVDKDKGPIPGIVISLTGADGKKFYTEETDAAGYAEVLVPVGQKYEIVYVSLGRREISASVPVSDEPNQNVKLTLRYKRYTAATAPGAAPGKSPNFVLDGVNFDTAKATIRPESFARLESVVEYMTHKKSSRIQISGHTDNVGKPKNNKDLSEKRAQACRDYLVSKGIDASRIEAVGYGDERPIAPNDTEEGRQKNRRIEATEL